MAEMNDREKKELEMLKRKSPYALPDNPSQAGWTSAQIKEKFYSGLIYLYSIFKDTRNSVDDKTTQIKELTDQIKKEHEEILSGKKGFFAEKDIEGNLIIDTYARKDEIPNSLGQLKNDKNYATLLDVENKAKHVFVGNIAPSDSKYDTWFDISENEPVMMTYGRREPVEELTFNDTEGEILIFESDSEELTFNDDDDSNLTFNEE